MILKTEPLEHQKDAFKKLSKIKVGALYMEMGTGKTRTALELIADRVNSGKIDLVIWLCPFSIKDDLIKELKKHIVQGFNYIRVCGIQSLSSSVNLNMALLKLVHKYNTYLIVDESNLVKNFFAKRTRNIIRLSEVCPYKLILNGTPVSKNEKDLFAQWYILDYRILGYKSYWSFSANHLEYDPNIPGKLNRVLNVDYLTRKIAPYSFQATKKECLSLPKKKYHEQYFDLTERQRDEYEMVKERFLMQLDELKPTTIYRLFTALQHVVSGRGISSPETKKIKTFNLFDGEENPRLECLKDTIEQRCVNSKVVIWCKYTDEILEIEKMLKRVYGDQSTELYYGKIKQKERQKAIERFGGSAQFLIANKTCAGYGLNLQYCNKAIYYSNDFDYATRAQSEDRIHRIGQQNEVEIIDISAKNTIDENIIKCLLKKEALVESFKREIKKRNEGRWLDGNKGLCQ